MNTKELQERLLAEGCNPHGFSITPWGSNRDVYVLEENCGIWEIYYTERGSRRSAIATFKDEAEACEFYYKKITAYVHRHIVCSFENEAKALEVQAVLEENGISYGRNDSVPLRNGSPPLKRVYVEGTDIFRVRELYSGLPLVDYERF